MIEENLPKNDPVPKRDQRWKNTKESKDEKVETKEEAVKPKRRRRTKKPKDQAVT